MRKSTVAVLVCGSLVAASACKTAKHHDETLSKDLVAAATSKNVEETKSLLARNANPNAKDEDGTPEMMGVLQAMMISLPDASSGTISGDQQASETRSIIKGQVGRGAGGVSHCRA
jgi:hypothetical protein